MDILTKIKIDGIEYELGGASQPATVEKPGVVTIGSGNSGLTLESPGRLSIDKEWLREFINTYLGTGTTTTTTTTTTSTPTPEPLPDEISIFIGSNIESNIFEVVKISDGPYIGTGNDTVIEVQQEDIIPTYVDEDIFLGTVARFGSDCINIAGFNDRKLLPSELGVRLLSHSTDIIPISSSIVHYSDGSVTLGTGSKYWSNYLYIPLYDLFNSLGSLGTDVNSSIYIVPNIGTDIGTDSPKTLSFSLGSSPITGFNNLNNNIEIIYVNANIDSGELLPNCVWNASDNGNINERFGEIIPSTIPYEDIQLGSGSVNIGSTAIIAIGGFNDSIDASNIELNISDDNSVSIGSGVLSELDLYYYYSKNNNIRLAYEHEDPTLGTQYWENFLYFYLKSGSGGGLLDEYPTAKHVRLSPLVNTTTTTTTTEEPEPGITITLSKEMDPNSSIINQLVIYDKHEGLLGCEILFERIAIKTVGGYSSSYTLDTNAIDADLVNIAIVMNDNSKIMSNVTIKLIKDDGSYNYAPVYQLIDDGICCIDPEGNNMTITHCDDNGEIVELDEFYYINLKDLLNCIFAPDNVREILIISDNGATTTEEPGN